MRNLLPLATLLVWAACGNPGTRPATEPDAPPQTERSNLDGAWTDAELGTESAAAAQAESDTSTAPVASNMVNLQSLEGSSLKFNGVYENTSGDLHYYMRFFERGNVALIAGREQPEDSITLRRFLTQDVKSGLNNAHNVPVTLRNDSLFFTTMAPRGEITYAGVADGDTLRFLKHSKVTAKKAVVSYHFIPD